MDENQPRELAGFKKKSFKMAFGGGEIWFEHLDGIYDNENLALEKLAGDRPTFCRPSYPSVVAFVLDETRITNAIIAAIADALLLSGKYFQKVCFVGADKQAERALRGALRGGKFAILFIDDLQKGKEWLITQ